MTETILEQSNVYIGDPMLLDIFYFHVAQNGSLDFSEFYFRIAANKNSLGSLKSRSTRYHDYRQGFKVLTISRPGFIRLSSILQTSLKIGFSTKKAKRYNRM